MKQRNPLRFKTEKEFEKEFGKEWRFSITYYWASRMDSLFGSLFNPNVAVYVKKDYIRYSGEYHMWSIHPSMLTRKRIPKYLEDGTQVRVGMKLYWSNIASIVTVTTIYTCPYATSDDNFIEVCCTCNDCKTSLKGYTISLVHTKHLKKL